jgi:hypothetical protein
MAYVADPPARPLNAAAERYARLRLQQLVQAHLLGRMPTSDPGAGGLAAVWRQLSGTLGAPAAGAGYGDPGFWLRQGGPSEAVPGPRRGFGLEETGGLPAAPPVGADLGSPRAALLAALRGALPGHRLPLPAGRRSLPPDWRNRIGMGVPY